ncbi:MAG: putative zinc-binding peptidase [Gammaproteobacteria bacterium]|nr:putative zinc-binding peptidase [Gammaproteobacteria bacterium]MBT8151523.1 putative zinc-binding peptidase [Gammaproteobacteria bacterium]NNL10271.1 hypothetical protein [Pseudomonadales bacterium]NNM10350.1 hypothetical protein [Pseudomonadales bacterium]RZV55687.1 MAG: hypothetical protein EX270_06245 [Pseudomonadales bacterium]
MKSFRCDCGQRIFFESKRCVHCGAAVGFDPQSLTMLKLAPTGEFPQTKTPLYNDNKGRTFTYCNNGHQYDVCNWLVEQPEGSAGERATWLCSGCLFNRNIPYLGNTENLLRWRKFEFAKKRLLFTLMRLQLPLESGFAKPGRGLLFDFVEDQRTDPERYPENFATTGHSNGLITINALEADDAAREEMREELNEHYRTLLGHLRHESGHYYYLLAEHDPNFVQQFSAWFGDPTRNYEQALAHYYDHAPIPDWQRFYITAYASSHPLEDWAESWGHYLHIYDALETAASLGISDKFPSQMSFHERIVTWRSVSVALNELNRSSGLGDVYPFVLNEAVENKMAAVDACITALALREA